MASLRKIADFLMRSKKWPDATAKINTLIVTQTDICCQVQSYMEAQLLFLKIFSTDGEASDADFEKCDIYLDSFLSVLQQQIDLLLNGDVVLRVDSFLKALDDVSLELTFENTMACQRYLKLFHHNLPIKDSLQRSEYSAKIHSVLTKYCLHLVPCAGVPGFGIFDMQAKLIEQQPDSQLRTKWCTRGVINSIIDSWNLSGACRGLDLAVLNTAGAACPPFEPHNFEYGFKICQESTYLSHGLNIGEITPRFPTIFRAYILAVIDSHSMAALSNMDALTARNTVNNVLCLIDWDKRNRENITISLFLYRLVISMDMAHFLEPVLLAMRLALEQLGENPDQLACLIREFPVVREVMFCNNFKSTVYFENALINWLMSNDAHEHSMVSEPVLYGQRCTILRSLSCRSNPYEYSDIDLLRCRCIDEHMQAAIINDQFPWTQRFYYDLVFTAITASPWTMLCPLTAMRLVPLVLAKSPGEVPNITQYYDWIMANVQDKDVATELKLLSILGPQTSLQLSLNSITTLMPEVPDTNLVPLLNLLVVFVPSIAPPQATRIVGIVLDRITKLRDRCNCLTSLASFVSTIPLRLPEHQAVRLTVLLLYEVAKQKLDKDQCTVIVKTLIELFGSLSIEYQQNIEDHIINHLNYSNGKPYAALTESISEIEAGSTDTKWKKIKLCGINNTFLFL